ncbi:MAG: SDR family oxidoreductase [Deltaproteobacteria bacterium]|nr:SDR family oxidoreductase [Deltaproteobacteria bacterium]
MSELWLKDKVALVTGGSRGLGRAVVARFVAEGARAVVFTYGRDLKNAEATVAYAKTLGTGDVESRLCSVRDGKATDALVREIEQKYGAIDVLVNNAGITQNLPLALIDEEDWDLVMDTNVKGTFVTSRAVLRGMIRRKKGVVINMGSLAGERMIEAPVHYSTSKAALRGMTEALAKEVGRYGIRVLLLAPGLLEDGLGRNLPEHRLTDYVAHCALGRVGTFEEVADLCAFLASDDASYMTGATVIADGGV